jgi:multidrug efflux pump subunit AcrB
MRLPKLAIENHQFTIIVICLMVLSGLVSFFTMPRSEDPQISPAGTSIIVVYPGANPTDLEELVVDPIEEVINELEDIKDIKTTIEDGLAVIGVEFLTGSDPDEKYSDVVQKVNSIRNDLPEDIARLQMQKWSISDVKILQVAIISESAAYRAMEKEAEELKKAFERVPGIHKVQTWAFPEQEIRISLDMERAAQNKLSLNRIINAVQSSNSNIPGGKIDVGVRQFNIQTSGSYNNIEEIRNTIVDAAGGKVVYLKDIAEVDYAYQDDAYYARVQGKKAVFITCSQKPGTNIYNVFDGLRTAMKTFKAGLPQSMHMKVVFDQSESVSHRVNGFFGNLMQGLILVGLVVFLAVGIRASLIVILAIPISILIAIGFVDLSNFGLQQMTIVGLVISLGLLVDNAIVVTENISRFIKQGMNGFEAAVKGTSQIAWAIVSSTVTTVLAFVPIIMMQNITGEFIRGMPVTVVYTLSASLLVALTLTPYLSSKFIGREKRQHKQIIHNFLNKFIETKYRKSLDYALKHPAIVIFAATLVFLSSLVLFMVVGVTFFPKAEKPQFLINVKLPEGTSLDKTNDVMEYVESVLSNKANIKTWAANVGAGNPRIYYNQIRQNEKSNYGQILAVMNTRDLDIFNATVDTLRNTFEMYPGAKIELKVLEQGPPIEAPIAIRVIGDELEKIRQISLDVENIIQTTPGTINIHNPLRSSKTDIKVEINRAKAAMFGVPVVDIDRTVRAAITGISVSKYRDLAGKEYDIVIRLPINKKPTFEDFDKIYVNSYSGEAIPLKQLASIKLKSSPQLISHYNLDRNVLITADVVGDISASETTQDIIKKLDNYNWPKGYRFYAGGELESREESFGGMQQAVIIAIVGIFAVLVLQFRSYVQPLIVFSALPLAIIGSVYALLITGYSFSFTAFVGITSLVGIVINNSIILVDYTNQLRTEGKSLIDALKEAGETRFMPIILTTGTTIGGLLPLTLGGGTLWAPMGWTIIGGLVVSTFLTLIVVPVLYKLMDRFEKMNYREPVD